MYEENVRVGDTTELISDFLRGSYTAIQREYIEISFHVYNQAHIHHSTSLLDIERNNKHLSVMNWISMHAI